MRLDVPVCDLSRPGGGEKFLLWMRFLGGCCAALARCHANNYVKGVAQHSPSVNLIIGRQLKPICIGGAPTTVPRGCKQRNNQIVPPRYYIYMCLSRALGRDFWAPPASANKKQSNANWACVVVSVVRAAAILLPPAYNKWLSEYVRSNRHHAPCATQLISG